MDINEAAPVITRDEIVVRAPIETIWEIQTNVDDWPSWQPDVDGAESEGPLEVGSVFHWQTAGLDITSTVREVDAPRRVVWGGPAQGIVAVHVWTLEPQGDGVLVRTAESWEGEPVEAQVESLQGRSMRRSAHGWRTSSALPSSDRGARAADSLATGVVVASENRHQDGSRRGHRRVAGAYRAALRFGGTFRERGRGGAGRMVLVSGEAGIGKTSLVRGILRSR